MDIGTGLVVCMILWIVFQLFVLACMTEVGQGILACIAAGIFYLGFRWYHG
jgi:hypothetical protein